MKNMKLIIFALLLVVLSPAAMAHLLLWDDPYWLPVGTSDPNTISDGDTVTASSAGFGSADGVVSYRAELRTSTGTLIKTLESHSVSTTPYTGYETVTIDDSDYTGPGTYFVRFTISDSTESFNKQLRLIVGAADSTPTANLVATPTSGSEGMTVSFTCTATGGDAPLSYNINFGDGTSSSSSTATHTYTTAATRTAVCTVTDGDGDSDSDSVTIYVANNEPVADFTVTPTSGNAPLTVSYTCTQTGGNAPYSYLITFGDGATSASNSGSHTYSSAGDYTATCRVTDTDGDWDEYDVDVSVVTDNTPSATLVAVPGTGPEGTTVTLVCSATGGDAPLSYQLNFGDGSAPVSGSTATHQYLLEGSYPATCTVTDADSDSDTATATVTITDNAPVVDLVATPTAGDAPLSVAFTCGVTGGNAPFTYSIDFGDGDFATTASATHVYSTVGSYAATCTVVDSDADLGSDTEGISVTEGNVCPVMTPVADVTTTAGNATSFTVSATDGNAGDTLTYSADAPFAAFVNPATGAFSWTPVEAQVGSHAVTFRVSDGSTCDVSHSMTINVVSGVAPNTPPTADFTWTPTVPEVGETVSFTSTSTDPELDTLTCAWDFNEDGWTDSTVCNPTSVFSAPGSYDVTLTVNDGEFSDSVTHTVVVVGQLNVTGIDCFDPVIEDNLQSCSVNVSANGGLAVGSVNVQLYFNDSTLITNCITDMITGNCVVTFPSGDPGNYTVYATAQKAGWLPDGDMDPTDSYTVLEKKYIISNLAVYNDSAFSQEDYDYFRGESMYVNFMVLDEFGVPADHMVTSVALVSPPGGKAWFSEFTHTYVAGNYWYNLAIPTTHDFLGDSQVFTFAFNFTDGSGSQMVVEVVIRNNPPVIDPSVASEFSDSFNSTTTISLTPYESDVEDAGEYLTWRAVGVDTSVASVYIESDDTMTVTPVAPGYDVITLVLTDLDGDTDTIDVGINTGSMSVPQCSDSVDNDGDGLVDMADPGCAHPSDDNEADQCNDGIDNDGDGLVDMVDPGCVSIYDNDETDIVILPQCSDSIDNDGDGLVDMVDPGCSSPSDDDETDPVTAPQCSDGLDNDGDGRIDWPVDPGCVDSSDDDETDPAPLPQCRDALDNDGDGLVDMLDPGCTHPDDNDEYNAPLTQCSDFIDNDGDGLVDMADPGCSSPSDDDETDPVSTPQCNDGVDNDGDGLIDLADPGCVSIYDDDETDPIVLPQCADGLDNDGDGLVDMADPGCSAPSDNDETDPVPVYQCNDGLDNDGDGLVDMADPGCSSPTDDDETNTVVTQCSDGLDNDGDGHIDLADPGCTDALDDDETDFLGNQPPVAVLDLSRSYGAPGMIANVSGVKSYDNDGTIVEHSWVVLAPDNTSYTNLHVAGAPLWFAMQFNAVGTYQVRLTVVDDDGASDTEVKTVVVGNGYPQCDNGIDDDGDGNIDWPADIHCANKEDPMEAVITSTFNKKPFRDMDDLLVTRIDINGYDVESAAVQPGDFMRLSVGLENTLDYTLDDVKVDMSIQDLGIRTSGMVRELDPDESATEVLTLDIPYGAAPGLYDLRVVVSNDDVRRVKYRVITIA